jgi:hypothetical protein
MLLLSTLFVGLAAAVPFANLTPAIKDVKIISISATGTGCPSGSAQVTVDATGSIFDVAFDRYIVNTGPGQSASDSRKNCRVSINLQFPSGYQFSIIESRFQGYASLPSDQTGTCRAAYTFSGDSSQEVVFQKDIRGTYEDNFELIAGVGVQSWSKCGGSTAILNVNSEIRITPVNSPKKGTMTVDSFDGSLHVKFQANWRRC